MAALKRLSRELKDLRNNVDPAEGIGGGPQRDDDLFQWDAYIRGPAGTPWEEVHADGSICVDILENWTPLLTTRSVLLSLQSLLDSPNIESPANPEAAQLFCTDRRGYNRRVRAIAEDCSDIECEFI